MNSSNINKDTDQSPQEGRHSLRRATDDLGAQSFPLKPQYAILVEAGWPGGYHVVERPAPMPVVGLKPRRGPASESAGKTFSVQDPDWEQVEAFKAWCRAREVTFKSAFDLAIREFLILHS